MGAAAAILSDGGIVINVADLAAGGVLLIFSVLEILGIIPDPLTELIQLFSGRPREQATAQVVAWLEGQKNAAARLWGITLSRLLTDFDIVISSSSPGDQAILSQARANFIQSLQQQGVTSARAQEIAQSALSASAQSGTLTIPELQQSAPAGFQLVGPSAMQTLYNTYANANAFVAGKSAAQVAELAEKYMYKHATPDDLLASAILPAPPISYQPSPTPAPGSTPCAPGYYYDPATNTCWLSNTNVIGPQTCPPGYNYDSTSLICDYQPPPGAIQPGGTIPQPPPAPGTPPGGGIANPGQPGTPASPGTPGTPASPGQGGSITIPPPPTPQPGGDELTDCCNSTATYLYYVATAITQLVANQSAQGSAPAPDNSACCASLVAAITQIATIISSLPAALGAALAPSAQPIDLSGLETALAAISTSLASLDTDGKANAGGITTAINAVASAVASGQPVDLTQIIAALNQIALLSDIPQAFIDSLIAAGFLSPVSGQLLGGAITPIGVFGKEATKDHDYVRNIILEGLGIDIDAGGGRPGTGALFTTWLTKLITQYLKDSDAIVTPVLQPLIEAVATQLQPAGTTSLGNIGVNPDTPVQTAFSVGITATIAAGLLSYFGIDLGEPVTRIAELIATGVGLEELRDITLGPLIRNGIAKVADMSARAQYRQDPPALPTLMSWAAKGYITTARAAAVAPLFGMPAEFVAPAQQAAYSNLPERFLLRLFDSPTFSQSQLTRLLQEHGLNAADTALMLNAFPYLATQTQRTQLQAAYEAAYAKGMLTDQAFTTALTALQDNVDYASLLLTRVQIEKSIAETEKLENSYIMLAEAGVSDLPTFQSNLTGLNLTSDWINVQTAVVENKLTATAFRQAAAAERTLVRQTVNEERRAALKNFAAGNTDAIGLAAALLLTGLTAVQAAAWVDLAVLQKSGVQRSIYGLLLDPQPAQLLRSRVTALSAQRRKALITDAQYSSQLQSLGIPQNWINALLAAADANIDVVGAPAFVNVSTS